MNQRVGTSLPLAFVFVFTLCAQDKPKGLTTDWDIGAVLKEMSDHATRLLPVIDQIDPSGWILKGAPETYVAQWKSAKAQTKAFADAALVLRHRPDRLSADLEAFFRLQGLENSLASLAEGTRKYQNPALANQLIGQMAENGANRVRFQQYIVELAASREQEFQVMDHEAQRCRDIILRQPPAAPPARTGRK